MAPGDDDIEISIKNRKTGENIYSGPRRRVGDFGSTIQGWRRWISPDTIFKIFGFGGLLLAFFWRTNNTVLLYITKTDQRIQVVERALLTLTDETEKTKDFKQNSDSYHGALLSKPFRNGQPADPNYDPEKMRDDFVRRGLHARQQPGGQ